MCFSCNIRFEQVFPVPENEDRRFYSSVWKQKGTPLNHQNFWSLQNLGNIKIRAPRFCPDQSTLRWPISKQFVWIPAISHRHILSANDCNIHNICQKYFVSICLGAVKKSKHGGEVEKNRYLRFVRTPNLVWRQIKGLTEASSYSGEASLMKSWTGF